CLNDVILSIENAPLIKLLRPVSEEIYIPSLNEAKKNIFLKISQIEEKINVEIKEQQNKKLEEEKKKVEQEKKQLEEQLRQKEILRKEEENKHKQVEEQLRLEQERLRKEQENKRILEENKRKQVEEQLRLEQEKLRLQIEKQQQLEQQRQQEIIRQENLERQRLLEQQRLEKERLYLQIEKQEELKLTKISNIAINMRSCAAGYNIRRQEAEIQQKKHAEEFKKRLTTIRDSSYWEGYALGQQEELKLCRDKMYHFSSEIDKIVMFKKETLNSEILGIATNMRSCAAGYDIRRQEAEIQQKKHAEEFERRLTSVRDSSYWEGYALGQQEELKLCRDKMYHFSSEIDKWAHN
ncbi:MAG: hypothetical protein KBD90_04495, partial [Alphaproteobacteria bacterium]|nr:hypothetical protein [Alphaproteobacteria bacterium]